ncbi:MAG TPA: nucleotidyltransferase family protein [Planktothrix sp.]
MSLSYRDFFIRYAGQAKVFRLPKFSDLRFGERFFLYLLSGDLTSAQNSAELLRDSDGWAHFVEIAALNGFCTLIAERLVQIRPAFATQPSDFEKSVRVLQRLSMSEIVQASAFDDAFSYLLNRHKDQLRSIIWCKGSVLRQTIYSAPEHRMCNDFDLYVAPDSLQAVLATFLQSGFELIKHVPAFCNQLGVGPVSDLSDLLLVPTNDLVSRSAMTLCHPTYPDVDIKLTPLDRGLRLREEERFRSTCDQIELYGYNVSLPNKADHMLVCAINCVKDGLASWKSLYDVHLMAAHLAGEDWRDVVRRAEIEGLSTDLWICFSYAHEMLSTPIPDDVLQKMSPKRRVALRKLLHLSTSYEFSWNTNSLFGLCGNAIAADDMARKLQVIRSLFAPSREFLRAYYAERVPVNLRTPFILYFLHLAVVIMPSPLIRRTLGDSLWPLATQYVALENACRSRP